jgi:hypothetical protein
MGAAMVYDAAEGYVVLFGGDAAPAIRSNADYLDCTNATWSFLAGTWTNLSIPGPPAPESCGPLLAYDPEISAVVAYLQPNDTSTTAQTWEFAGGSWSRLNISTPALVASSDVMNYDGASESVILFGANASSVWGNDSDSTWEFSGSSWQQVPTTPNPFNPGAPGQQPNAEYDPATGQFLLIQAGSLFAFSDGVWSDLGALPFYYTPIFGAFDYDPAEGYSLLFGWIIPDGEVPKLGDTNFTNWTYAYSSNGGWSNVSVPGPSPRMFPMMTFDAADGYLLLYGGMLRQPNTTHYCSSAYPCDLGSNTWVYESPPAAVQLTVEATPTTLCSAVSPACGFGTDATTVHLGVAIGSATEEATPGVDDGNGSVVYGPYRWLAAPTLTFVGWGNLSLSIPFQPLVTCGLANGTPGPCPATPAVTRLPNGREALTWSWEGVGPAASLRPGDWWNITFALTAEGAPFGPVPIDRCTTTACVRAEGSLSAPFTALGFHPDASPPPVERSFPLAIVTVIGSQESGGTPPSGPGPAPPPPPVGVVAPVGSPTPGAVAVPAGPGGAGGLLSSISSVGAGAGILAAGITRAILSRPAKAMGVRVGSRLRSGTGRRPAPPRGEN